MSEILANLNDAQRDAVTSTEGFVRVMAGAGSGKTRALARRYAYLVDEIGILPENILCVTFTNKAANEMRERIHALIGDSDTGYICTFHSFCVSVLREDIHALRYPESFLVLDNSDIDAMLGMVYEERGLTLRDMTFSHARDRIEILKLKEKPVYYLDLIELPLEELYRKYTEATETMDIIFYGYLYQQKKCFGLDYNDLIKFTLYLFEQNDAARLKWQSRLEYILIDEFQDIDEPQYKLMNALCAYHKNLFIVGDPDQTIYTWRGANINYILNFDKEFPNVKTIMMMQNYRSTPQILAAVNSLINHNEHRMKKELIPMLPDGAPVLCHHAENPEAEALWITDKIAELHESGAAYRDMTVMYRARHVTRVIEDVLLKKSIPYILYSDVPFFNRAEIKDALSYLRMILYHDDLSFLRIVNRPKRNIGERRIKYLKEYAEANGCLLYDALKRSVEDELFRGTGAAAFIDLIDAFTREYAARQVSEVLSDILDRSGYEKMLRTEGSIERLDNLAELKQSVYEYETSCGEESTAEQYLARVALFTASDLSDAHDKVRLMTVHTAKGLEFPYVFLCAMNEGIFPSKRTKTVPAMEEERRLAFVAMTRAEKALYLSDADGHNFDGSPRYPSRFLLDIDEGLLTYTHPPREGLVAEAKDFIAIGSKYLLPSEDELTFAPGERVRHSIFGEGTILECDAVSGHNLVQFDGMPTPRKISFRAKLVRLP